MTRRITLTMVAVVGGALIVASLGTFLISQLVARREARQELGRQASRLATVAEENGNAATLRAVTAALKLNDAAVLRFGAAGRTLDTPPSGLSLSDLDLSKLEAGHTVTGTNGSLVFAAAPANRPRALLVVVLTRDVGTSRPAVGLWILIAGGVTLLIAAGVAYKLGRRLTRPLGEAELATRRIAAGDLATRVPEVPSDGRELQSLARSINAMAEELERTRGQERQFLMSVSHDLRTPLTSIRGFAEALADGRAPDPPQAASVILAEARRLERLVQDLLELAKLGSKRFSLDLRETSVSQVVRGTAEGFTVSAGDVGIDLQLDVGSDQLVAQADRDRLAQVVANLIENALKFARARIVVRAAAAGDGIEINVEDDGSGIAATDLGQIFEPFFQANRAPARDVGSGLGLAIVRELVLAMGGSVRAEPATGGGTRVVVSLAPYPAAQAGTVTG